MYKRGIFNCSFQLTLQSNNAYKISLKEYKSQPIELNDMNGPCLLINIRCKLQELHVSPLVKF